MLTRQGIPLETVYDLPLDVFMLYRDTAQRMIAQERFHSLQDTQVAIAGAFSKAKEVGEYKESLISDSKGE